MPAAAVTPDLVSGWAITLIRCLVSYAKLIINNGPAEIRTQDLRRVKLASAGDFATILQTILLIYLRVG